MSNQWQAGVFGCFNNFGVCVVTFFVPCYTFGKNAEALGEDCCMCCMFMFCCGQCAFAAQVALRERLRNRRDIEGSLTMDLLLTLCCGFCTLCQEAQEIRAMQGGQMASDPKKMEVQRA